MKSRVQAELILAYESPRLARIVRDAVTVDDPGHITSVLKDRRLIARGNGRSVSSIRQTLDDFLACVSVAEETARISQRQTKASK